MSKGEYDGQHEASNEVHCHSFVTFVTFVVKFLFLDTVVAR